MAKREAQPEPERPAIVRVRMSRAVAHADAGEPPRTYPLGTVATLARGHALKWHLWGVAELVDARPEQFDPAEVRAAARWALNELAAEQRNSGMSEEAWARVPYNGRRLAAIDSVLAALEPQEAA